MDVGRGVATGVALGVGPSVVMGFGARAGSGLRLRIGQGRRARGGHGGGHGRKASLFTPWIPLGFKKSLATFIGSNQLTLTEMGIGFGG
jgi:hypothetical protein